MDNKFNDRDKEMFIKFLNYIHNNAHFNELKSQDMIDFVKLLNHMQAQILPKIDANILEVIDVIEDKENKEE